jgi:hypothetical protein
MRGLGNFDLREALWAKQYWKAADEQADQKLSFEDVEKLCKRLKVNPSRDDLSRHFNACAPLSCFACDELIPGTASGRAEARIPGFR